MKESLVSILIPCYNASAYLSETLSSIVNQTYKSLEVILVNDGSKDNSLQVAKEFESKLPLKIIDIRNGGVSNARNIAFQSSNGKFVIFLDADDILKDHFIENKIKLLANSTANSCGSIIEHFFVNKQNEKIITHELVSVTNNFGNTILGFEPNKSTVPSAYIFDRSLIKTNAPFNINLSSTADRYFLLEFEKDFKMILDSNKDSGLLYRVSESSMSHNFNKKLVDDNYAFYKEAAHHNLANKAQIKKGLLMLAKAYFKISSYRKSCILLLRYLLGNSREI